MFQRLAMVVLLFVLGALLAPRSARALSADEMARGQAAVDRLNVYRRLSGLPDVALDVSASDGCVAHANYLNLNPAAVQGGLTAHTEVQGNTGYTAAGATAGKNGDIFYGGTGTAAVDGWYETYYHRNPMMSPGVKTVGYGDDPGTNLGFSVAVLQFITFSGAADIVTPGNGSAGNAAAGFGEIPLPVPNFGPTTGNPIIAYFSGATVAWTDSTITANGQTLAHAVVAPNKPANPEFENNEICLITNAPLPLGSTVNVTIDYTQGSAKTLTWSFMVSSNGNFDLTAAQASLGTGGTSGGGSTQNLTVSKLSARLNFAKPMSDSISLTGTLPVPAGFVVSNQVVTVNVGLVSQAFTLGTKASALSPTASFKLRLKSKKGAVLAQTAAFQMQLKKGSFATGLAGNGLVSAPTGTSSVSIPVIVTFNGATYQAVASQQYKVLAGKSGHTP